MTKTLNHLSTLHGLLAAVALISGCATVSTWEATGRAEIAIGRVECHEVNPDIDEGVAVVYGQKSVPVIPDLITSVSQGAVDRFPVEGHQGRIVVDVSGMCPCDDCGIDIVSSDNLCVGATLGDRRPVRLCQPGGFLLADLSRWQTRIAVPVQKEFLGDGREIWTVKVLDRPCIAYDKNTYMVAESGAGTVAKRLLFMPFAVAADVVTLPFQMILGLFAHM